MTPSEKKRLELWAAIILGFAALTTAWSAYQSNRLGGDEVAAFTASNQALADANFFYSQGASQLDADNALFLQFATAATGGDPDLAAYVRETLMSDNLQAAMTWWEETDEALTPFDELEGNPYTVEPYAIADEMQEMSRVQLVLAEELGGRGDTYDLAAVLLAVALFFGGISIVVDGKLLARTLLTISALSTAAGAVVALTA